MMLNDESYVDKLKFIINDLDINLNNLVVLTEAANGPYSSTSILALLAGAKVYAYSKNTKYGSTETVFNQINNIVKLINTDVDIKFIKDVTPDIISECDIITNSGHLRPLDINLLKYAKQGLVIPLMYESWELRDSDIDIQYCHDNSIPVAGTNECHPKIGVFDYLGEMAINLIENSGINIESGKVILISNNKFGYYIARSLSEACNRLGIIDTKLNKRNYILDDKCVWLSNFPRINIDRSFLNSDCIVFTAYPFDKEWIGFNSVIDPEEFKNQLLKPFLLRFAGDVNTNDLFKSGISYYPHKIDSGHMGILPSSIGYEPVIKLQAGGLKVGQDLINKKYGSEYLQMIVSADGM
jgi:hypothetical protein